LELALSAGVQFKSFNVLNDEEVRQGVKEYSYAWLSHASKCAHRLVCG
jgi:glutaredoxin-related protein